MDCAFQRGTVKTVREIMLRLPVNESAKHTQRRYLNQVNFNKQCSKVVFGVKFLLTCILTWVNSTGVKRKLGLYNSKVIYLTQRWQEMFLFYKSLIRGFITQRNIFCLKGKLMCLWQSLNPHIQDTWHGSRHTHKSKHITGISRAFEWNMEVT